MYLLLCANHIFSLLRLAERYSSHMQSHKSLLDIFFFHLKKDGIFIDLANLV